MCGGNVCRCFSLLPVCVGGPFKLMPNSNALDFRVLFFVTFRICISCDTSSESNGSEDRLSHETFSSLVPRTLMLITNSWFVFDGTEEPQVRIASRPRTAGSASVLISAKTEVLRAVACWAQHVLAFPLQMAGRLPAPAVLVCFVVFLISVVSLVCHSALALAVPV